jgi:hypothetical protein
MSTLFKKSLKLSIAAIATIKVSDSLYHPDSRLKEHYQRFWSMRSQASADEDKKSNDFMLTMAKDDLVARLLQEEFTGDMSKLPKTSVIKFNFDLKSRDDHLKELTDPKTEYDLLIIGGGANGAGVALDASSRGLKCAVVDSFDFASGTSSKSTKMAHGGIRYFE